METHHTSTPGGALPLGPTAANICVVGTWCVSLSDQPGTSTYSFERKAKGNRPFGVVGRVT